MRPDPSKLRRLILWDIDGTLLHAGPAARSAFDLAVGEALGRPPGDHRVEMSGKTDPQIALEILQRAGLDEKEARKRLPAVLHALVREMARAALQFREAGRVHPGVPEVLERLDREPGVLQSVLTGNLAPSARTKLEAFGLERFLDLDVGAFGSDDPDRDALIPIALQRVRSKYGSDLPPEAVWVIGDTPRDLACAVAGGARCLLVATGRIPLGRLEGIGAAAALADLRDTEAVLRLLLEAEPPPPARPASSASTAPG